MKDGVLKNHSGPHLCVLSAFSTVLFIVMIILCCCASDYMFENR